MKTKVVLFSLFTLTLFAFGTTVTLLFNTAPNTGNVISLFFLSLFVTLCGLFFLATFFWSYFRYQAIPPWSLTLTLGRLSLLLSLFLVVSLLMRSYRVWNVATGLVLLVVFVIVDVVWRRRFAAKMKS